MAGGGGGFAVAIKAAAKDAALTFLWVLCVSSLRAASAATVSSFLPFHLHAHPAAALSVTVLLLTLLIFCFNLLSALLGGASFNPATLAALYAAGLSSSTTSLYSVALRFPAQALGAVGGAITVMEVMPPEYKHMLGGPSLKVDPHTGAAAEGILTFLITFIVLCILIKGPRNPIFKTFLISLSTISLIVVGASYTGPAMNPANAFGWAYVNSLHNTWEQFYVFWISPFVGAVLAAWIFRAVFLSTAPTKVKKA